MTFLGLPTAFMCECEPERLLRVLNFMPTAMLRATAEGIFESFQKINSSSPERRFTLKVQHALTGNGRAIERQNEKPFKKPL
jgi:hypothetical protein